MTAPLRVLVADDDSNDLLFTREALAASQGPVLLQEVQGGRRCVDLLSGLDQAKGPAGGQQAQPPDLVLLDLNMPDLDGYQVLAELAQLPDWSQRVGPLLAVLSSADDLATAQRCYGLGCDIYLVKPAGFSRFEQMLAQLVKFAARVTQRPPSMPPTR